MIATCHPLPQPAVQALLRDATRALCDRPTDPPGESEARTHRMVLTTLGFEPRDGLEYMLATLSFAHYELILDSMRDVFQGQLEGMKARTKSGIVALDRALLGFVRELRVTHKRPLADWARQAAEARQAAAAQEDAEAQEDERNTAARTAPPARTPAAPPAPSAPRPTPAPSPAATAAHPAQAQAPAQEAPAAPEGGTAGENMAAFQEALATCQDLLAETPDLPRHAGQASRGGASGAWAGTGGTTRPREVGAAAPRTAISPPPTSHAAPPRA